MDEGKYTTNLYVNAEVQKSDAIILTISCHLGTNLLPLKINALVAFPYTFM
jgi:hypothetical protein